MKSSSIKKSYCLVSRWYLSITARQ